MKVLLEYIKVVSLIIIVLCLLIIAWNSSKEVSYIQEIQDKFTYIVNTLRNQ